MVAPRPLIGSAALSCVLGADPAACQELAWERTGEANRTAISGFSRFIGDVDGDGMRDVLTRAVRIVDQGATALFEEELWILSGRDGRTLRVRPRYGPLWYYADWCSAGDMDRDGHPDFAFAAWENAAASNLVVEVRSSFDDRLLFRLTGTLSNGFGSPLLAGRDLNGDQHPDLVCMGGGRVGHILAYDHQARLLYRRDSTPQLTLGLGGRTGNNIDWVGDVNGDGTDDYVLGAYDATIARTAAVVFSGRDGAVLVRGASASPYEVLGNVVSGCGDVDLDGVPDFAASSNAQLGERGLVQVFSGRTGQTISMWTGELSGQHLRSGDFDRDGIPDFAFMQLLPYGTNNYRPAFGVYSGRDGGLLHRILGCTQIGIPAGCIGGVTGFDAIGEPGATYPSWAITDGTFGPYQLRWPNYGGYYLGRISMFHGQPAGVASFGTSCAGGLATKHQMGVRDLQGQGVRLLLSGARPGVPAALVLGLSRTQWGGQPLPMSLAPFGFTACSLFTSIDALAVTTTGLAGINAGFASLDLPLPLRTAGVTVHGQWLMFDPTLGTGAATEAHVWRH